MGRCLVCGENSTEISGNLGACLSCIRNRPEQAIRTTKQVHARSRSVFGLPVEPPRNSHGLSCGVCANDCRIGPDSSGFCGIVRNVNGELVRFGGTPEKGILEWYYDDLPTNCVSWWFCPGCTGIGYPKYAYKPHAESGFSNLAIFYGACSFDCLFCQNWRYRDLSSKHRPIMSAGELVERADKHVSCICYFGGDPSPQMPHSLEVSRLAISKAGAGKRILRLCWETNGFMNPALAEKAAQYALETGGNIKFDLKTWNEDLNIALCGVSNKPSLENFKRMGEKFFEKRGELPVLTASTLLVPGYVDEVEVEGIARFIGEVNPDIPYTLLAFYPCYIMNDLPTTTRKHAEECLRVARKYLRNIRIGNLHLLQ